ncbi:iron-sulfur cluster co-chaperone protein HscB-like [Ylistrum balloti]|uniref:iron-sulfur cluster co-chaperone protein HscB-like n=1 Tax=Ylistrum balloti TaxID=509963 RepID=UPI002905BAE7|nr:iron-sulfur cluster co-chaperone protein HscB-like [Ylistrum balloti]
MSAPIRVMLRRCLTESKKSIGKTYFRVKQNNDVHSDILNGYFCKRKFYGITVFKPNHLVASPVLQRGHISDKPTFTLSEITCIVNRSLSTLTGRNCWKCGRTQNGRSELFICECGIVQEVSDLTYFQVLDIEETFDVDLKALAFTYKELQKILHPDKYSQKTEKERDLAETQSSLVNKAYMTLTKPLSRALYLLELNNQPIEESNSDVDPDFLMEIMEINEELADVDCPEALLRIQTENNQRLEGCLVEISKAFKEKNIALAKEHVIKMTYFVNVDDKIKEIYRKSF